MSALDLLVQAFEHAPRALDSIARARDGDLIAARVRDYAETALDQREVLAVLSEQHRRAAIVVKGEYGLGGRGVVRLTGGGNDPTVGGRNAHIGQLPALPAGFPILFPFAG